MSARARDSHYAAADRAAAGELADRDSNGPTEPLAIAAEVLTPAEVAALNARQRAEQPSANPNPFAALGPVRLSDAFAPAEFAELRRKLARAKQAIRATREAARAKKRERVARKLRNAPAPAPKLSTIDAALARAEQRECEKAAVTPRRLWTDDMRNAMAKKPSRNRKGL